MQLTYKAHAINKPEYMHAPEPGAIPTLISEADLQHYKENGWMVIGAAHIAVDFLSDEEVSAQQLDALKAELASVRASNQRRENAILDRISKLQSLTYEPA